jgi:hypothetical protein
MDAMMKGMVGEKGIVPERSEWFRSSGIIGTVKDRLCIEEVGCPLVLLRPPYAGIAAIALGKWQLREEPGGAQVEHGPALAAGLMPQVCDALRQTPCTWTSGLTVGRGRAGRVAAPG